MFVNNNDNNNDKNSSKEGKSLIQELKEEGVRGKSHTTAQVKVSEQLGLGMVTSGEVCEPALGARKTQFHPPGNRIFLTLSHLQESLLAGGEGSQENRIFPPA